ncbi:MAG: hypothetical protein GMKNLPBB_02085 [Myxococcota bacterium]|nr:hypothetical protein [Myxococcota bacterium]
MKKSISLFAAVLVWMAAGVAHADPIVVKFATLAPEGSTWMKVLNSLKKRIEEKSGGRLQLKIYAGAVAGDEKDVIRKMRAGQLDAAGFTGMGMGDILPSIRLLELPMLFKDYDEVDHVVQNMASYYESEFEKKGFVMLGWGESGFVHIYSSKPVASKKDLMGVKIWAWKGDPVAKALAEGYGVVPKYLALPDVLTSLQTGLIDACYAPPLAALALQWWSKVKYISALRLAYGTGGTLVSKASWDKIPPDLQKIIREESQAASKVLIKLTRVDNQKAIESMKKQGMQVVDLPPNENDEIRKLSEKVQNDLVGQMYSKELLDRVRGLVADFRKGKK